MKVRMTDFTALGCRLEGAIAVDRGAQMFVRLPGIESQPARLVWSADGSAGFEFEAQLHPAVAARFLPAAGSHAVRTLITQRDGYDPLLTRREQIMAGIAGSDLSPLQRKKKPTGIGLFGRIDRRISRQADTRTQRRYADAVPQGTRLAIEGDSAKVLNVSPSGMKVQDCLRDHDIGAKLALSLEGFPELTGELVWLNGDEAGISLPPLSIELFDRMA